MGSTIPLLLLLLLAVVSAVVIVYAVGLLRSEARRHAGELEEAEREQLEAMQRAASRHHESREEPGAAAGQSSAEG